ncbi:hypothetical protein KX816_14680 [Sphingosinicellaceae bacterium]|nr:hypothetical protein KX816_14680 [Sphingosinicellaceae bacterium]
MKIGPLGCLALLGAGTVGWVIGRIPAVIEGMRRDVASAEAQTGQQLALAAVAPARAPDREDMVSAVAQPMTRPPPHPRHAGERQHLLPSDTRPFELVSAVGAGVRQHDEIVRTGAPAFATEPETTADALALPGLLPGLEGTTSPETLHIGTLGPLLPVRAPQSGFALATAGYADLAAGDRYAAAAHFAAALAADPTADNAPAWQRTLRQLTRRWSNEAYVILRGSGGAGLGTTPVLGGGQGGRSFSYTATPLANHPLYAVVRTIGARTQGLRIDGESDTEQAALGLRWRAGAGATVSVERLVAITAGGRSAWTVRLAGGATRRIGPLIADGYGEAAVVGARRRDLVAGVQARVFRAAVRGALRLESGIGIWSGWQRAGTIVDRFDIGPTLSVIVDSLHLRASVDYRVRVVGNADPGSGPALTVSQSF